MRTSEGKHSLEIPQFVNTYIDTLHRQDVDAWLATFAPDGTYCDPATAQQPLTGQVLKDVVGGFFAGFPDAATETGRFTRSQQTWWSGVG